MEYYSGALACKQLQSTVHGTYPLSLCSLYQPRIHDVSQSDINMAPVQVGEMYVARASCNL